MTKFYSTNSLAQFYKKKISRKITKFKFITSAEFLNNKIVETLNKQQAKTTKPISDQCSEEYFSIIELSTYL